MVSKSRYLCIEGGTWGSRHESNFGHWIRGWSILDLFLGVSMQHERNSFPLGAAPITYLVFLMLAAAIRVLGEL